MAVKREKTFMITVRIPESWVLILDQIAEQEHEETGADVTRSTVAVRGIYHEIKKRIEDACPACGTVNVPSAKHCVQCGVNLHADRMSEVMGAIQNAGISPVDLIRALKEVGNNPK